MNNEFAFCQEVLFFDSNKKQKLLFNTFTDNIEDK